MKGGLLTLDRQQSSILDDYERMENICGKGYGVSNSSKKDREGDMIERV